MAAFSLRFIRSPGGLSRLLGVSSRLLTVTSRLLTVTSRLLGVSSKLRRVPFPARWVLHRLGQVSSLVGWVPFLGRWVPPLATVAVAVALVAGVAVRVDLAPRVEADFFFAPGDPQLRESQELTERYSGGGELVIVRAEAADAGAAAYRDRVAELGEALGRLPGVGEVFSVANQDPSSPLWSRVLVPSAGEAEEGGPGTPSSATNLALQVDDGADAADLTRRIEATLAEHEQGDFRLLASGVPVIVELIRRGLARDLRVFSTAALLIFGLVAALAYRDARLVAGTMLSCVCACAATLLATAAAGVGIGLLTANIVTIVFVLTLSHTVFLTAAWRRETAAGHRDAGASSNGSSGGGEPGPGAGSSASGEMSSPVRRAAARTIEPSLWCMATTFAGFMSLWAASAKPLRELGTAGAIGTVIALACAFTVLPAWLASATKRNGPPPVAPNTDSGDDGPERPRDRRLPEWSLPGPMPLAAMGLLAVLVGMGTFRLNTDPGLLSYFDSGGPIRPGLEAVDREGGSSPLLLAVGFSDNERFDDDEGYRRMWQLQESLEADPATGIVLSPAPILGHARTFPLANFLPVSVLIGFLERPEFGGIARGFLSEDRREALYSVRMIEGGRTEARDAVVERLAGRAEEAGLAVRATGGLYDLQDRLGKLVAGSLRVGLGGLLGLFLLVGFLVSRSMRTATAMLACLAAVPAIVLGAFGHLRVAVDIVTSPAANVALAMGVDSMIHLVTRVRRLGGGPALPGGPWRAARDDLAKPVATACAVICAGFGIFALSDFPPTRRFGAAVILGTLVAATAALAALPGLTSRRRAAGREPPASP